MSLVELDIHLYLILVMVLVQTFPIAAPFASLIIEAQAYACWGVGFEQQGKERKRTEASIAEIDKDSCAACIHQWYLKVTKV